MIVRRVDKASSFFIIEGEQERPDEALSSAKAVDAIKDDRFAAVMTREGYIRARGRLARTGTQLYGDGQGNVWREYRSEDEVFSEKSLATFNPSIVTDDHPDDFVNSENARELTRGIAVNVGRDGIYMVADVIVTDAELVEKIMNGKVQISNGYTAKVLDRPGITASGEKYDKIQTDIEGNHTAIVQEGRAGPMCCLTADGAAEMRDATMKRKKTKDQVSVTQNGKTVQIPEEIIGAVAVIVAGLQESNQEVSLENIARMLQGGDEPEGEAEAAPAPTEESAQAPEPEEMDSPQIKVQQDAPQKDEEQTVREGDAQSEESQGSVMDEDEFRAKVDARFSLLRKAEDVIGKNYDSTGKSDAQVVIDCIAHVDADRAKSIEGKKLDSVALEIMLDAAIELKTAREAQQKLIDDAGSAGSRSFDYGDAIDKDGKPKRDASKSDHYNDIMLKARI